MRSSPDARHDEVEEGAARGAVSEANRREEGEEGKPDGTGRRIETQLRKLLEAGPLEHLVWQNPLKVRPKH